jgi:serine protease Do
VSLLILFCIITALNCKIQVNKMEMRGSQGIADVVENIRNSIATVRTSRYGRDQWGRVDRVIGSGTGMIISSSGYIATNFHVVAGSSGITVITPDNEKHSARISGL